MSIMSCFKHFSNKGIKSGSNFLSTLFQILSFTGEHVLHIKQLGSDLLIAMIS